MKLLQICNLEENLHFIDSLINHQFFKRTYSPPKTRSIRSLYNALTSFLRRGEQSCQSPRIFTSCQNQIARSTNPSTNWILPEKVLTAPIRKYFDDPIY
ncbi:hypothetical protein C0J52_05029 [Blattella germanica]|nr:hypothetical protein C0J52_05029 [Blattella germanica]